MTQCCLALPAAAARNTAARFPRHRSPLPLRLSSYPLRPYRSPSRYCSPAWSSLPFACRRSLRLFATTACRTIPRTRLGPGHTNPQDLEEEAVDEEAVDEEDEMAALERLKKQIENPQGNVEAPKEKKKKEKPPPPPPTYPERPPLPEGASLGDIPIPLFPENIRPLFSYLPYLCLGPSSDGGQDIVPQPLPNHRDLIASHELFNFSRVDRRWGKPEFIRCETTMPDIAFVGRMRVGQSSLIDRLATEPICLKSGTPNWKKVGVVKVIQSVIAYGFSPIHVIKRVSCRMRVYDLPCYGHRDSAHQIQSVGKAVFRKRILCRGCVLVVNCVHGIQDHDNTTLLELAKRQMPFVVVLNKAEYNVPAPDEKKFPIGLWQHLLDVAKGVYAAADEHGARPFLRGVYVTGASGNSFDQKPMGLLGVRYAIARMAGLVGEDDWGKPLNSPKSFSNLTSSETPLASDPEAMSLGIKYLSPETPDAISAYSDPNVRDLDAMQTTAFVKSEIMARKVAAALVDAKQSSGLTGTKWRTLKARVEREMSRSNGESPELLHVPSGLAQGGTRLARFARLREVEDTAVDQALNGSASDRRMQEARNQRRAAKLAKKQPGKKASTTEDAERAEPLEHWQPEPLEHWRAAIEKKKNKSAGRGQRPVRLRNSPRDTVFGEREAESMIMADTLGFPQRHVMPRRVASSNPFPPPDDDRSPSPPQRHSIPRDLGRQSTPPPARSNERRGRGASNELLQVHSWLD